MEGFSFQAIIQRLFPKPNFAVPIAQHLAKNLLNESKGLDFLWPDFEELIKELLRIEALEGRNWQVGETFRSFEKQKIEYAKGRDADGNVVDKQQIVTWAKAGTSYHAYGLAVDFHPPRGYTWTTVPDVWWFKMGQNAEKLGLRWGGEWNGLKGMKYEDWAKPEHQREDSRDRPHVEWHPDFKVTDIAPYFK